MSKFTQTSYGSGKEILKFNHFVATSVSVSDVGVPLVDGKKIVKAGTIVGGKTKKVLLNPQDGVVSSNDDNAEGVLITDVDVTHGLASGSMCLLGFIDLNKLPEQPTDSAIKALKMITFMK